MTAGSWICDDLSMHMRSCARCRATNAEERRKKHERPGLVTESDVPPEVFEAMCPHGRSIYRSYLRWLAEPD